jgi:hypothetical protein
MMGMGSRMAQNDGGMYVRGRKRKGKRGEMVKK